MERFDELGLSPRMLQAVAQLGYEKPTAVQQQAIPLVLAGRDVVAAAKTGTGKTAAFALPCLDRLGRADSGQGPLLLVVTPTRELAQQIGQVCGQIAQLTGHRVLTVVGGVSYNPQVERLQAGADVLIATPGRLVDLMGQGAARLGDVQMLVVDEADRMLDMGFWPTVRRIVAATPPTRQTLLFSATIDEEVAAGAEGLLRCPAVVQIAHKGDTADAVEQFVVHTQQAVKPELLRVLLQEKGAERVIVFTRTRGRADATCRRLVRAGFAAEAIHSSRSQNQRRRALQNFEEGATGVIVATDVLARGIDVEAVDYVVNYDLPHQPEDYVHRIGRTGRAGAAGFAVSFATPETADDLAAIERLIGRKLPELELSAFDAQAAERRAMEKAHNADARRDPELALAKKEQAARKRKKAKARAKAAQNAGNPKGAKSPAKKAAAKKGPTQGEQGTPRAKARGAADAHAAAPRAHGKRPAKGKAAGTHPDNSPGRANRAAAAKRRAKGR